MNVRLNNQSSDFAADLMEYDGGYNLPGGLPKDVPPIRLSPSTRCLSYGELHTRTASAQAHHTLAHHTPHGAGQRLTSSRDAT